MGGGIGGEEWRGVGRRRRIEGGKGVWSKEEGEM